MNLASIEEQITKISFELVALAQLEEGAHANHNAAVSMGDGIRAEGLRATLHTLLDARLDYYSSLNYLMRSRMKLMR